jgi:hypothetical protein
MKALIFLAALLPAVAWSQVMVMPNKGGGEIVLTARDCVYKGKTYEYFREAYAWGRDTNKIAGCWQIYDGNILVVYHDNGEPRIYPITEFKERK